MKPLVLGMVLLGLFTMPVSASPLIPVSMSGMKHLTAYGRDIVEVKKWGTPPGWSRGRKVGWRGLGASRPSQEDVALSPHPFRASHHPAGSQNFGDRGRGKLIGAAGLLSWPLAARA